MRALVTGGAGFLGSVLVDRLLAQQWAVEVVDDLSAGSLTNLADARADRSHELRIHRHDLRDPATVPLLEHVRPDVVFHLAAASGAPAEVLGVAALGTYHLLEGARTASCEKVVAALSGPALYAGCDPAELPLKDVEPSPVGPAGLADAGILTTLRAYRAHHLVEHTAVVLPTVYGPRQRPEAGAVASIAASSLSGEPAALVGAPADTEDLLFVDDAVDALVRAAERGSGLCLHAATGVETSLQALVAASLACGASVEAEWRPAPLDRPSRLALDPGRASIHLGWEPFTDLDAGLRATFSEVRERAGA